MGGSTNTATQSARRTHRANSTVTAKLPCLDTLGVAASSLCLAHCLLLPVACLALPSLGITMGDDGMTHFLLAFFVTAFCLAAIVPGYLRHGNRGVLIIMLSGLSCVLVATFFVHALLGETWEIPLITLGNVLVVAAHLRNRKLLAYC